MENKQSSGFETSKEEYCHRIRIIADQFKNRIEAAKATGTSKSTLQTWIDGSRIPSFDGIARLASAAGVSLDWIAFGIGDDPELPQPLPTPDDRSQLRIANSRIDKILNAFNVLYCEIEGRYDKEDRMPELDRVIAMYNLTIDIEDDAELDRGIRIAMIMHGDSLIEKAKAKRSKPPETADDQRQA